MHFSADAETIVDPKYTLFIVFYQLQMSQTQTTLNVSFQNQNEHLIMCNGSLSINTSVIYESKRQIQTCPKKKYSSQQMPVDSKYKFFNKFHTSHMFETLTNVLFENLEISNGSSINISVCQSLPVIECL